MTTVALVEADAQMGALLSRLARGEEIVITQNGKPVARLVPDARDDPSLIDATIAAIRSLRRGRTLGGLSIRELRDQGQR